MNKNDVGIFARCFGIVGKILFLSLVSSYFAVGIAAAAAVQECVSTGRDLGNAQGIVMELTGNVTAQIAKGGVCPVSKGQTVVSDTVITTGEKSTVVLRFADGQGVSLQENSTFHVQQYVFDQANAAKSNIVFALLKGGARFVTGLIGQKNKEAIKISAGTTTIGIRGTAFTVAIMANGTVVGTVTSGSITIGGTTFVAGQSFAATLVGNTLTVAAATPAQIAAATAPTVAASGVVAIPAGVTAGTMTSAVAAAAGVGAAAGAGLITPAVAAAAAAAAAAAVVASQETTSPTGTTGTTGTTGSTGTQ